MGPIGVSFGLGGASQVQVCLGPLAQPQRLAVGLDRRVELPGRQPRPSRENQRARISRQTRRGFDRGPPPGPRPPRDA